VSEKDIVCKDIEINPNVSVLIMDIYCFVGHLPFVFAIDKHLKKVFNVSTSSTTFVITSI